MAGGVLTGRSKMRLTGLREGQSGRGAAQMVLGHVFSQSFGIWGARSSQRYIFTGRGVAACGKAGGCESFLASLPPSGMALGGAQGAAPGCSSMIQPLGEGVSGWHPRLASAAGGSRCLRCPAAALGSAPGGGPVPGPLLGRAPGASH